MKVSIQYFDSSFIFIIGFKKSSQIKRKQSYYLIVDFSILNCRQAVCGKAVTDVS